MSRKAIDLQLPDPTEQEPSAHAAAADRAGGFPGREVHGQQGADHQGRPAGASQGDLRRRPEKIIFVKGDPKVKYSDVIYAMDVSRGAGVKVIGVSPKDQPSHSNAGYRPPVGVPSKREGRWKGVAASLFAHALIFLLILLSAGMNSFSGTRQPWRWRSGRQVEVAAVTTAPDFPRANVSSTSSSNHPRRMRQRSWFRHPSWLNRQRDARTRVKPAPAPTTVAPVPSGVRHRNGSSRSGERGHIRRGSGKWRGYRIGYRHRDREREWPRHRWGVQARIIRRLRRIFSCLRFLRLPLCADIISLRTSTWTRKGTRSCWDSIRLVTADTIASFATCCSRCGSGRECVPDGTPVRDTVDIQFIF